MHSATRMAERSGARGTIPATSMHEMLRHGVNRHCYEGANAVDHPAVISDPSYDNVDPDEAERFRALADKWWDAKGPFWPLHRLNRFRTAYLKHLLAGVFDRDPAEDLPLRGLRLLDVGCGGGILSESMARLGATVHGIDIVAKNIEVARLHARDSGLPVQYAAVHARALRQHRMQFDAVLNMEVVEHVPDPAALVDDCAALLRPGGALVLATINRTWLSWLFAIFGAEYVLRWLPKGTHRWDRFITPGELARFAERSGLQLIARTGIRINPFNRRFALTPLMAVNYMMVAQRIAEAHLDNDVIRKRAEQSERSGMTHTF